MGLYPRIGSSTSAPLPPITESSSFETHKKITAFKELWEKEMICLPADDKKNFRKIVDGFAKELEAHKSESDTINHRSFWTRVAIDDLIKAFNCRLHTHYVSLKRLEMQKKEFEEEGWNLDKDLRKPLPFPRLSPHPRPETKGLPLASIITSQGEKRLIRFEGDCKEYAEKLPLGKQKKYLEKVDAIKDQSFGNLLTHIKHDFHPNESDFLIGVELDIKSEKLKDEFPVSGSEDYSEVEALSYNRQSPSSSGKGRDEDGIQFLK